MKKFIFAVVGILALSIVVYSCSQDEPTVKQVEQTEQKAFDDLNAQIALLNAQYHSSFVPQTRGRFWNFFKRIFSCDLFGAAIGASGGGIGAVVCGIYGSIMGIITFQSLDVSCEYTPNDNGFIGSQPNSLADSVGYYHNLIIRAIYEANGNSFDGFDDDRIYELVCNEVASYFGEFSSEDDAVLSDVKAQTSDMVNYCCDITVDNPAELLETQMPEFTAEIGVLQTYVDTVAELPAGQIAAYTGEYSALIEQAAIPAKSKQMLQMSINVGGNSSLLWVGSSDDSPEPLDPDFYEGLIPVLSGGDE